MKSMSLIWPQALTSVKMILFTLFTKDYFKNEKKNSKVLGKVDSVNPHLADGSVFAAVSAEWTCHG